MHTLCIHGWSPGSKGKYTGPSGKPVIMMSFPSTDMSSNTFALLPRPGTPELYLRQNQVLVVR